MQAQTNHLRHRSIRAWHGAVMAVAAGALTLVASSASKAPEGPAESVYVVIRPPNVPLWPVLAPSINHTVNEDLFRVVMEAQYGPDWQRRLDPRVIGSLRKQFLAAGVLRGIGYTGSPGVVGAIPIGI